MVKNKPSTSSLHATQTPLSASTNMSPNMPDKLPIRSLGAEASNARKKALEVEYAIWGANGQEGWDEWEDGWDPEEQRQVEQRCLAIMEKWKQERKETR
ncbi:hypothetical protein EYC80_005403 [Monilinia laxa]|uniref:Uncharacterized protein n=1 Tax=Monilinia laxa TaxID=61186 RepID=A0A5N6KLM0_MONLA|nr:hypothetical protein EYC80_005403 [Monilinia laxa]